jgi:hypothetical protein
LKYVHPAGSHTIYFLLLVAVTPFSLHKCGIDYFISKTKSKNKGTRSTLTWKVSLQHQKDGILRYLYQVASCCLWAVTVLCRCFIDKITKRQEHMAV